MLYQRHLVRATVIVCLTVPAGQSLAGDEGEKDRLQQAIKDEHVKGTDLWIYNDIAKARAEARRQNKPLFVTFRCVPCKDCAAFDAEVAKGSERIERLAREHFVAVRQVEMKGVDLSLFQFDYDLNWAAMFINADGTVYARYGTQSAAGADAYNSIEGLEKTMRRVLALHEAYPKNRAELKGKRGPQKPYKTALEMPGLENKERYLAATTRQNCIHCHNIHDAEHNQAYETGKLTPDLLWRYPLPENIGLVIDPLDGIRVKQVKPDSPAAKAGIVRGEEVTHVGGQVITSIADIQWVLHRLPNTAATLTVETSRTGRHTLSLPAGWKKTDISWRGSIWSLPPRLRIWMPELTAGEKRKLGVSADQAAFLVKWINTGSPAGRAARRSGLRPGDVVVGLDGRPLEPMSSAQFNVYVKLHYKVGDKLPLTILRDGRRRTVTIELVE